MTSPEPSGKPGRRSKTARLRRRAAKATVGAAASGLLFATTIFGGGFAAVASDADFSDDLADEVSITGDIGTDEGDIGQTGPAEDDNPLIDTPAEPTGEGDADDEVPSGTAAEDPASEPADDGTETPNEDSDRQGDIQELELTSADDELLDEDDLEISAITPLAVGVPTADPGSGEAKIIINAGGVRTGSGNSSQTVSPLAGVTYDIYRTTTSAITGGDPVGACTTDSSGQCGIIAVIGSGNTSRSFYAVAKGAPAGWSFPSSWSTGDNYRFATGTISTGGSTDSRTVTLPTTFNGTVSSPTWANVLANNPAPQQCGIDIAMVVDLSNSVTDDNDLLDQYKAAANSFVDTLTGTPSQIGLYTFATNAPANGTNNVSMQLTPVSTPASASTIKTRINGMSATPQNIQGGTNWDRGFHQVAESGVGYDVVLFLTDGAPTFYRDQQGTGGTTTIREVNEAIHSANAVKAMNGSPAIIAVGIGPDALYPEAARRLSLISGPTENVDYYRTGFDELEERLHELATANCGGTVTVVKQIVDSGGNIIDETPGGWQFTATADGNYLENGSLTNQVIRSTEDGTGAVNFGVSFASAPTATRNITIAETQQLGYALVQQDGANAVCTVAGEPITTTNSGDTGFAVGVQSTEIVTCTVQNRFVSEPLTVSKTAAGTYDVTYDWMIEKTAHLDRIEVPDDQGSASFTYDVTVTPSAPILSNHRVSGVITVTNPNASGSSIRATVSDDVVGTGSICSIGGVGGNPVDADSAAQGYQIDIAGSSAVDLEYECDDVSTLNVDGSHMNMVTVTWDDGEAVGSAPFEFEVGTVTRGSVTVTDSEFDPTGYDDGVQVGNVVTALDGPTVFTYDINWPTEAGECVLYDNVASISEADESSNEVVTLCAGSDLEVSKNVVHSFDRTYLWNIDKSADETQLNADPDTGFVTAEYTVIATPVLPPNGWTDSAWTMSGTITIENTNEWLDITADVMDSVDVGGGALCTVTDGVDAVIPAGQSSTFDYLCTFTNQPSYAGTNTATAVWADQVPTPSSSTSGTADVEADGWSVTPINDVIDVIDDKTDPANPVDLGEATWNADGTPTVLTYSVDLQGTAGTCVDYTNTAWISQTGQEAAEDVTVCMEAPLEVSKTVNAEYERTYLWDVDKTVDRTSVTVDEEVGQAEFNYTVSATPDGFIDSGWTVTGEITVTNPNTFEAVTVTVIDIADGAVCSVDGGVNALIGPGSTEVFDYSCSFTDEPSYTGTNTARITAGDEEYVATADINFELSAETDLTVDVVDDKTDPANPVALGQASWSDDGTPTEFNYSLTHEGVPGTCVTFTNTAWLVMTSEPAEAQQAVDVCVESALVVTKTVEGSYDRTYLWDIEKDLGDGQEARVFVDDVGTAVVDYLISVSYEGYEDSNWIMDGTITVTNPNDYASIEATVSDTTTLDGAVCTVDTSADINDAVDGVQVNVPASGSTLLFYSCELESVDEADYLGDATNTATAVWGESGTVSSSDVPIFFAMAEETDASVDIYDDLAGTEEDPELLGTVIYTDDSPTVFDHQITFDGTPGECVTYTNTAWVAVSSTNPSDTADVTVCETADLTIEKTATALFDRDYDWTVSKMVDETAFEIAEDGTVTANYTVTADAGEPIDTNKRVIGTITVTNPNISVGPIEATVEDTATIAGATCTILGDDADPDTPGHQIIINDGQSVDLSYECDVPADTDINAQHLNTATVTWGESGTASGTADVVFTVDELTDDEVTVADEMVGRDPGVRDLGTADADESPKVFNYSEELAGIAGTCTDYTNTAIIDEVTQDDEGNSASVIVTVCAEAGLTVVKTAEGSFTRDYSWAVEKDVDETDFHIGADGTATATYSVTAAIEGYVDQDWALTGSITVSNPNDYKDMTVSAADTPGMTGQCVLDGGATSVDIAAGEATTISYDCAFPEGVAEEDYSGLDNLVEITWTGPDGEERSANGTAPIDFIQTGSIDDTVTVIDDQTVPGEEIELGTVTAEEGSHTFVYEHELQGDPGFCTVHTNTAFVAEAAGHDENNTAAVDVTVCAELPLEVEIEADAQLDRLYLWDIDKSVGDDSLDRMDGETGVFDYLVTVTPDGYEDSNQMLTGSVTVTNPNHFIDLMVTLDLETDFDGLTCIADIDDADPEMDGVQVLVPRGDGEQAGKLTIDYDCAGEPEENSITVTVAVVYEVVDGETSLTAEADVTYELASETDWTITVIDDLADPDAEHEVLGTAEWNPDGTPMQFAYSLEFEASGTQCATYTNTAQILETGQTSSADVTLCSEEPLIPPVKPAPPATPRPAPGKPMPHSQEPCSSPAADSSSARHDVVPTDTC